MRTILALVRRFVGVLLALWLVTLVGLMGLTQIAQHAGFPVFVIRGGSMAPAIPLGALVVDQPVDPALIAPGDVVSVRQDNGALYTHRVVQVVASEAGLTFQTRGDSNASPDPAPVPSTVIAGRVIFSLPIAGFLLVFLGMPSGILSLLAMVGSLLLLYWLLEDLELDWKTDPTPIAQPGRVANPVAE